MGSILRDLRYGFRVLLQHPGFTAVALLSLALGIGANTTIFSFVNALLLRPFPVKEPERLVTIHTSRGETRYGRSSYPNYEDMRDRAGAFSGVLARSYMPVSVKATAKPEVVLGNLVSTNYLDVLGVKTHLGRTFLAEEGVSEGSHSVAILSYGLWKRSFGSDPEIVGKKVLVNNFPFTVVGVGPEGFTGVMTGYATDVWIPMMMARRISPFDIDIRDRGSGCLDMVGRLKDGVTVGQAQAAVDMFASNLRQEHPDANAKGFAVVSGSASRFAIAETGQGIARFMAVLMGVVGLVLLVACSNMANLLLARAARREREIAMRLALGAKRGRIVRQLLTESMLLSVLAGLAGLLFAIWAVELLGLVDAPSPIPVSLDVRLDSTVLGYTFLLSMLTGLIFGLAPAMRVGGLRLFAALKDRRNASQRGPRKSRLQSCLVTGQVALSLVLLIGTAQCLQSLRSALTTDPGFEVRNRLVVGLNLAYGQYDEAQGRAFYQRLGDRVGRLPGVQSSSLALFVPLSYVKQTAEVSIDGYETREGDEDLFIDNNSVGVGYFETLGMPILQGRGIDERDRKDSEPVLVVNETMARRFWKGQDPIGRTATINGEKCRVVGVATDGKYFHLAERPQPFFYRPLSQMYSAYTSLLVKTAGNPRLMVAPLLREVDTLDPNLPVDAKTLSEHMQLSQYPAMMTGIMVGGFGFLALALAMVGVYGVMSYSVSQRTHEFGIRTALGARRSEILKLVLGSGLKITLAGVGIGLIGALAATHALKNLLYGVSALDPLIFLGVSLALMMVALLACYIPARRAAKVDPIVALRYE